MIGCSPKRVFELHSLHNRFVRIFDRDLAEEYSLTHRLPALVYFRRGIPLVYTGDLSDEPEVLEWLILHQNSIDDEVTIEPINGLELDIMVQNVDNFLVMFHDRAKKSQKVLLNSYLIEADF